MNKRIKWKSYSLDSVARLVSGRTPDREKKEYYATQGTPWVKIENLEQGYITESSEYLSPQGAERVNLVPKDSVLFSIVGTVGKVGIAGKELATNQQIVALVFDEEKIDPLFGYYCLRYCAEEIKQLSDQTTMALISRKTLGQYKITVPERIEEQKKIVERLEKFEKYIQKKEEIYQGLVKYEQILFHKIFGNEILYHERLKLRDFLTDSISSGIPKSEEPKEAYPHLLPEDFESPYLKEKKEVPIEEQPDKKYLIQEGDVLIRNGRLFLAEEQKMPLYIDRSVLRIRVSEGQLLPEVLYGYLNLPEIKETLYTERKEGDSRKRPIRGTELERMLVPYFTMDLQKEYRKCLKKIRKIQRLLDTEIQWAWKSFWAAADLWLHEQKEKKEEFPKIMNRDTMDEEQDKICHLILAVLAGWAPEHDWSGTYFSRRQEIFKKAQFMFQPVALTFVTSKEQKDYLLERDFLMYRSLVLCQQWKEPFSLLKKLLKEKEEGEILDAHLAFPGVEKMQTEKDWSVQIVREIAKEGFLLLASYSGFESCSFLF